MGCSQALGGVGASPGPPSPVSQPGLDHMAWGSGGRPKDDTAHTSLSLSTVFPPWLSLLPNLSLWASSGKPVLHRLKTRRHQSRQQDLLADQEGGKRRGWEGWGLGWKMEGAI